MDRIPQELVNLIASFVGGPAETRVAPYESDEEEQEQSEIGTDDKFHNIDDDLSFDFIDNFDVCKYNRRDLGADQYGSGYEVGHPIRGHEIVSSALKQEPKAKINSGTERIGARAHPASISQCTSAMEIYTFRKLRITSYEINDFRRIVRGDRRKALKDLVLVIMLSPSKEVKRRGNNQRFTNAILSLFSVLHDWETEGLNHGTLKLELRFAYSKRHLDLCTDLDLDHESSLTKDPLEYLRGSHYVQLLPGTHLPIVNRVTGLYYRDPDYNLRLAHGSLGQIVASLPSMSSTHLALQELDNMFTLFDVEEYRDNNPRVPGRPAMHGYADFHRLVETRRRQNRLAFAQQLSSLSSLRGDLGIFMHMDQDYRRTANPGAIYEYASSKAFDPLSEALRKISTDLTVFKFTGLIDSSLFWPKDATTRFPRWPNLEKLSISFDPQTPCGKWYFAGTQNASPRLDDSDLFPSQPVDEYMNPLLLSFAKAVGNMPSLQVATINSDWAYGFLNMRIEFRIVYLAPGIVVDDLKKRSKGDDDTSVRRFYFQFGSWMPNAEVLTALTSMGANFHGPDFVENFLYPPPSSSYTRVRY